MSTHRLLTPDRAEVCQLLDDAAADQALRDIRRAAYTTPPYWPFPTPQRFDWSPDAKTTPAGTVNGCAA